MAYLAVKGALTHCYAMFAMIGSKFKKQGLLLAIYHFSTKIISRAKGQSAVACAAYRTSEKMYDERYEKWHDYTRKEDVVYTAVLLPAQAPEWMGSRETLWNHVEKIETRKDSRLAREFEVALPRELTLKQNIALIKELTSEQFTSKGLAIDVAIHEGTASDGARQPHAHIMVIEREIKGDGFGKKYRGLNQKETLLSLREAVANVINKHLAMNGHDVQVDHRSLKGQGIDLVPQKKIGPSGLFHRMASYAEHQDRLEENGKRLLKRPEIVFDVLTNHQSTFTHQDIARVVNRYTVDADQFQAVYAKVKASSTLVSLGRDDKNQERFTTRGMLQLEAEMMANAWALHDKKGHSLHGVSINSISAEHGLSKEQHQVLEYLVSRGDLKNVVGYAGTGKSRLLGAAREAWEASGHRVLGATLSGIAAENLEASSGIESRTFASRSYYWMQGRELLTSKDILVVDEAGMLGTRQLAEVVEEVKKQGAKVALVGDPQEQLQAIEAGAAFRGIIENTSKAQLTEIWRQKVGWQKEATVQFSTRQTATALAKYAAHDCVHEFATQSQAKQAVVDAWNDARINHPEKTQIILAYTRNDVKELNTAARSLRQSLGELGRDYLIRTREERGNLQKAKRFIF